MVNLEEIIKRKIALLENMLIRYRDIASSFGDTAGLALHHERKKNRIYYYIYDRSTHTKHTASPDLVARLQNREYFKVYVHQLEKIYATLSAVANKVNLPTPAEINALLRPAYRSNARTRTTNKTDEERAWLMQMEAFKRKHPSSLDAPTIKVYDNVFTRTRAEAFCMLLLDKYNITYIYECPIFTNGKYRYPDFTLLINGKVFLWEHLGLIYDKDYYDKQLPKFNDYASIGYKIGSNLFLSFDGPDGDFDCVALENTLLSIINIAYM